MSDIRDTRSLLAFTTTRPVAILMMVAAAVVFGVVSLRRMPVNLLPDISYPTVTIRTSYPGASPHDVEERVSERIQEAVAVISNVRRVVSVSRPETSDVILELEWGTQMVFAVSDIRERLDRVFLPDGAERPLVLRYDPSLDPVMTLGLSGEKSLIELRRIAEEEIERELAEIEGVAAVKTRGGDEEEIRVSLDEDAISFFGLDPAAIGRRLAAENLNAASGSIEEGKTEYLVRTMGEFRNLADLENLVIERRGEVPIRLGQIAKVQRLPADKEVISQVNGKPVVLLDVHREAGTNIVQLCTAVRDRVYGTAEQRAFVAAGRDQKPPDTVAGSTDDAPRAKRDPQRLREREERERMTAFLDYQLRPFSVHLTTLQDQSRFIEQSVDEVVSSAIQGGGLAVLIIFLFLRRFSPTAIISLSIPISLVATFAPMLMSDIDLNIMSLGGLALGVGMLVDNSIVVLESITRAREAGLDQVKAAIVGTSRVAGAVISSTLTTVAVFFPIVFVEGVAGQLFYDQALTVVYSLLTSLAVSLFVVPMLASRRFAIESGPAAATGFGAMPALPGQGGLRLLWLPVWLLQLVGWLCKGVATWVLTIVLGLVITTVGVVSRVVGWTLNPFAAAFQHAYARAEAGYLVLVRAALRHRGLVLLTSLGLLAFTLTRVQSLGSETLPEVHQGELYVDTFLPRDATVERCHAVMAPLEQRIATLPEVAQTSLACGVDSEELHDSDQGEHSARLLVRLRPHADRPRQEEDVRNAIRALLEHEPDIQSHRFSRPSILTFTTPLVVEVIGHDLTMLREASNAVEAALRTIPGLRDVRSTLQRGNPEIAITLDRDRLSALGLDPAAVTAALRSKIQGDVPTRFTERERKIDIRVRVDRDHLATTAQLQAVNVKVGGKEAVPLASVATLRQSEGPSEIRRIGNLRGAEVQASLTGLDLGRTQELVLAALADVTLPRGIEVRLAGQRQELEASQRSLTVALLLAVLLVYMVMASQFESLIQPLVILVTLPLALIGVILALDLLGIPLSIVVFLGLIVLAGIVVNNAIILIDQINQLRAAGLDKRSAIAEGAHTRLRPVLMTTLTTLLGLLPLTGWLGELPVLGGSGEGVELRGPMAITVIAGLGCATLLTLVVIPVVYSFSDRRA